MAFRAGAPGQEAQACGGVGHRGEKAPTFPPAQAPEPPLCHIHLRTNGILLSQSPMGDPALSPALRVATRGNEEAPGGLEFAGPGVC